MSVHQFSQDLPCLPKKCPLFQVEFQAQGVQGLALSGMEDFHSGFTHSLIHSRSCMDPTPLQEPSDLSKCEDYLLFRPYHVSFFFPKPTSKPHHGCPSSGHRTPWAMAGSMPQAGETCLPHGRPACHMGAGRALVIRLSGLPGSPGPAFRGRDVSQRHPPLWVSSTRSASRCEQASHQWGAVLGGLGSSERTNLPPASQSSFPTESAYLATLHMRLVEPLQGALEDP